MVKKSLVIMLFFNFKMFILKPLKLFMVKKQGGSEVFSAIKIGFSVREYFSTKKQGFLSTKI